MRNTVINPLSANPTKWSNTLKQFSLSVFDHFVGLVLKELNIIHDIWNNAFHRMVQDMGIVTLICESSRLIDI